MKLEPELRRLGIEISPGIGILGLDFSVCFPEVVTAKGIDNWFDLDLSLSTGPKEVGRILNLREDAKLNQRYKNKIYVTLSQKFNRQLCQTGSIIRLPHRELADFKYLNIYYVLNDNEPKRMSVPISMNTSDTSPAIGMSVKLYLEILNVLNPDLSVTVFEGHMEAGWSSTVYSTDGPNWGSIRLTPVIEPGQEDNILFNETVQTVSQRVEDVLMW